MTKETLTSVTDGSYIRQLAPNVCGVGWIVQDKLTGKKVNGVACRMVQLGRELQR